VEALDGKFTVQDRSADAAVTQGFRPVDDEQVAIDRVS